MSNSEIEFVILSKMLVKQEGGREGEREGGRERRRKEGKKGGREEGKEGGKEERITLPPLAHTASPFPLVYFQLYSPNSEFC